MNLSITIVRGVGLMPADTVRACTRARVHICVRAGVHANACAYVYVVYVRASLHAYERASERARVHALVTRAYVCARVCVHVRGA